jgi:hypothetical protein
LYWSPLTWHFLYISKKCLRHTHEWIIAHN